MNLFNLKIAILLSCSIIFTPLNLKAQTDNSDHKITTVCISPGHPSTPGDKPYEAVINRKVAYYLYKLLLQNNYKPISPVELSENILSFTDPKTDAPSDYPYFEVQPPIEKADFCNKNGADFLISIHHNFSVKPNRNYTTVFYSSDENFNPIHKGAQKWSEITAKYIHRALKTSKARNISDSKYLKFQLGITSNSNPPAILTEASFYSNPAERKRLNKNSYLKKEATAIFKAFNNFINKEYPQKAAIPPIKKLESNHKGKIMILMYHDIGYPESTWRRTPEHFMEDLNTLYSQGYRAISLKDYVNGNINIEKGKTPVVITFDDGTSGQFTFMKDNIPDEKSAVGILVNFYKSHPDFGLEATFFLTGKKPFGETESLQDKINFILQNGMDIGNHTVSHKNLGSPENQNDLLIQKEIGKQAQYLETLAGKNYKVDTIALCYGGRPKKEHHKYIIKGKFNNIPYQNSAILNVGSKPALSPFDEKFNPAFINRVRASKINVGKTGLYNWLNHFIKHPEQKYIQ